mmetsp:Transcript_25180/g.55800  ORF Transcript_25180/g.55800 Transcript_25180/m.55800 type:complete len:227 (-) Transcript_25180:432-1112(-)|eukprot:CAMPEP_0173376040 /NCGR_PEP_ID=MMETSP1144-20121109/29961_1 /TAXON_ID=483371 /ORGANISM="non described non described, Strain CCMP2298" /LENGTH=226 /DNA_ID=CAMNT_0014328539 /DNA_START=165 /DNA_END=845 /DNA_ORIENTATION=+
MSACMWATTSTSTSCDTRSSSYRKSGSALCTATVEALGAGAEAFPKYSKTLSRTSAGTIKPFKVLEETSCETMLPEKDIDFWVWAEAVVKEEKTVASSPPGPAAPFPVPAPVPASIVVFFLGFQLLKGDFTGTESVALALSQFASPVLLLLLLLLPASPVREMPCNAEATPATAPASAMTASPAPVVTSAEVTSAERHTLNSGLSHLLASLGASKRILRSSIIFAS